MTTNQIFFSVVFISILFGCSQPDSKTIEQQNANQEPPKDTTYYFVKRLLNASHKEVEEVLGIPDTNIRKSKDCDHLPYCDEAIYQNGNFQVRYFNNKLKGISINNINGLQYNNNLVECLNFPASIPSLEDKFFTHWDWNNYNGIQLIGSFPKDSNPNEVKYIIIQVSVKYDKKFDLIIDEKLKAIKEDVRVKPIDNQAKREEQEKRKEQLKPQFSAWDGSHINLTKVIKKAMNDPQSYEHVETVYWDMNDHLIVQTQYRGNNAFGGKVLGMVKAKVSINGDILEIIAQQ